MDCPKFQEILCLRQIRNLDTEVYIEKPLGPFIAEKRRKFSNFNKRLGYGREYSSQENSKSLGPVYIEKHLGPFIAEKRRKFSNFNKRLRYEREDSSLENSESLGPVYMDSDTADRPVRFTTWVTKTEIANYMDSDTADRPVRFTIWVTKTEFNFDIIGGIAIEYLNGRNIMFGKERTDSSLNSVHTFTLGDNEFITKVILGTTDHLDKITFFSNFAKTYGPYGGNGGYDQVERPPGNNGYFYSLFAKDTINGVGLCSWRLLWVYFSSEDVPGDDDMHDEDGKKNSYEDEDDSDLPLDISTC